MAVALVMTSAAHGQEPQSLQGPQRVAAGPRATMVSALSVEPGATCLERDALLAQIEAWLPGRALDPALRVKVVGDPARPRRLHFTLSQPKGKATTRAFDNAPADCAALHAIVGLSIALAVDATLLPVPEASPEQRLVRLAAVASLGAELLSGLSLGLQADAEFGLNRWLSLRMGPFAHHSRKQRLKGSAGTFNATLLAAFISTCAGGQADTALRLSLCVGPAAGALHVRGQGYSPNAVATGLWVGFRAGLRLQLHLALDWVVDMEVVSALLQPRVQVHREDGGSHEKRLGSTALLLSLGPSWEL